MDSPPSAGSGGSSSAGTPSTSAGMPGTSGTTMTAGQATGTGGSIVTPQGGSAGQAGSGSAGGSSAGGGSAGNAASGGSAGGTGGGGGTSAVDTHFKLAWRDDFDSFNDARWSKQTHTFAENLARFSAGNVVVEGGFLKLKVTNVQNGDKAYSAAEVATKEKFTYGRFAGRIKFCAGSGVVSSLFTYKTENVNTSWQEIDIEHLGNLPKSMQYNLISGTLANRVYQPKVVTFQWGPPLEFHDYVIEWRPDGVTFFVDGVQTHKDVQASIKDAATLHMNAWPTDTSVTTFAGPFDPSAIPCEAQYDWVEAYTYTP
ncbi:MAG TPA: family 16 glycosylhydrolase [Polyangiaceae bacterium]|nr:family 16 glycosylhydrolase [Polyangiaceae bacterium]